MHFIKTLFEDTIVPLGLCVFLVAFLGACNDAEPLKIRGEIPVSNARIEIE